MPQHSMLKCFRSQVEERKPTPSKLPQELRRGRAHPVVQKIQRKFCPSANHPLVIPEIPAIERMTNPQNIAAEMAEFCNRKNLTSSYAEYVPPMDAASDSPKALCERGTRCCSDFCRGHKFLKRPNVEGNPSL